MSKFDLKKFQQQSLPKNEENHEQPDWVTNSSEKVKLAYQEAERTFEGIKIKMELGEDLNVKDSRLVLAKIANEIDVSRSYLTHRRTPELCKLVQKYNEQLDKLWQSHKPKAKGKSLSKEELIKELSKTKRLLKEERDSNYSEAIIAGLESELHNSGKKLANKCADLSAEIEELRKINGAMKSRLRAYTIKSVD